MNDYGTKATHRCQTSLERRVSIRLCNPYKECKGVPFLGVQTWWLLKHKEDYDWLSHYLDPIAPIDYCPFCGAKLDDKTEE